MKRTWLILALCGAVVVPASKALSADSRPKPTVAYVVTAGDTLWRIAARLDGQDRRAAVDEIMDLNDLSSARILPGQTLRLPAR